MCFDPGPTAHEHFRMYLNLHQFRVYAVFKGIMVGALPDIDLWLFEEVSRLMVGVLKKWNLIDSNRGTRPLEIMRAMIRYMVVSRAITAVHDVPGGPLYNVPYEPAQITVYGPYLCVTLEMILDCWHIMHEEYIHDDAHNVLRSWMQTFGYNPEISPYENFAKPSGGGDHIPFARKLVTVPGDVTAKELIDLNYFSHTGTIDSLAKLIAPHTKPRMSDGDVKGILESLKTRHFVPPDNKRYRITDRQLLAEFARGARIESLGNRVGTEEDLKFAPLDNGPLHMSAIELIYTPVSKEVRISTRFLKFLDVTTIKKAFYQATVCGSFPRQKVILGMVMDDEPDLFQVEEWTDAWINAFVGKLDRMAPDSQFPRSEGVAINQMSMLTHAETSILFNRSMDPRQQHRDDAAYDEIIGARSEPTIMVTDWELQAAERQYLRCGLPLAQSKTEAKTERYIRAAYNEYMAAHPEEAPAKLINYPMDILLQRQARDAAHQDNNRFLHAKSINVLDELESEGISAIPAFIRQRAAVPAPRSIVQHH
jgi:hypothetical protein